ncbi:MAG TPA: hypothetical protein VK860_09270 [Ilumatobacteraceae bacterium]|nr:hypothetical protein [Ilumatobacteraceae bacterium]
MNNTGIPSGSADTAPGALSVSGPQPVWMTLDEARERSFTGEIVFEVDPEVFAYLDNGDVYYAERRTDSSLGRRLLEAGVVDTSQLERGTVRVGDVEHLGRLFDRDPSVDRDAVLVVTETSTDDLIAELANQAVTTVRVTAYRHHPSGVHRWFVTRLDASSRTAAQPPFHAPMIEELSSSPIADDELLIEWDEIDEFAPSFDPLTDSAAADDQFDLVVYDTFAETVAETVTEPGTETGTDTRGETTTPAIADEASDPIEIDFGHAEEAVTDADAVSEADAVELFELSLGMASVVDAAEAPAPVDDGFEFEVAWPDGSADLVTGDVPVIVDAAPFTQTEDGDLRFELPEITTSDDVDQMPDDVAEAVRRAIAAIESATAEPPTQAATEPAVDDHVVVDTFEVELLPGSEVTTQVDTIEPPAPVAPAAPAAAFAPPTMDMRAEVMYARAEEAAMATDESATWATDTAMPSLPTPGVASVVFVDDEPSSGSGDERSSALRRLIGSLRRKEH